MLTLREAVIEQPFRDRRYRHHRQQVASARPRIDAGPPSSRPHLSLKLRKLRLEEDRQQQICDDNIRLAHRMALIMRSKRLDNYNIGPVGPYEDVCPRLPPAQPPSDISRTPRLKTAIGLTPYKKNSIKLPRSRSHLGSATVLKPIGRPVLHRSPAGWCRVPHVGETLRSGTPPLPHTRRCLDLNFKVTVRPGTKITQKSLLQPEKIDNLTDKQPDKPQLEGLSVRCQLEPLVTLTRDSPHDSEPEETDKKEIVERVPERKAHKKKTTKPKLKRNISIRERDVDVSSLALREERGNEITQERFKSSDQAPLQRNYSFCSSDNEQIKKDVNGSEDDGSDVAVKSNTSEVTVINNFVSPIDEQKSGRGIFAEPSSSTETWTYDKIEPCSSDNTLSTNSCTATDTATEDE